MTTRALLPLITPLAALALAACSSGSTPDASAGDSTSPSTPAETTGASGDAPLAGPDFCSSIAGLTGIDAGLLGASDELNAVIGDSDTWDDPATVTALHDSGQAMLDEVSGLVTYYEVTASQVDDPEVSAAVLAMSDLYGVYFAALAEAAIDATDVMSYAMEVVAISGDATMAQVLTDGTDAAYAIDDYARANCTQ